MTKKKRRLLLVLIPLGLILLLLFLFRIPCSYQSLYFVGPSEEVTTSHVVQRETLCQVITTSEEYRELTEIYTARRDERRDPQDELQALDAAFFDSHNVVAVIAGSDNELHFRAELLWAIPLRNTLHVTLFAAGSSGYSTPANYTGRVFLFEVPKSITNARASIP